jgi:hypothetical protein
VCSTKSRWSPRYRQNGGLIAPNKATIRRQPRLSSKPSLQRVSLRLTHGALGRSLAATSIVACCSTLPTTLITSTWGCYFPPPIVTVNLLIKVVIGSVVVALVVVVLTRGCLGYQH